ncbi:MAG: nucleotidyltransferase domain-containing protein [Rhodospirillales bacterium]|jgi:predicted nucleotidyltransferase|nr:nucleotidyltransferase domain-containing protein [Rhodospirillales bacterium]
MNAKALPTELIDSVVSYFHPRRIILFGSMARGDAGPDSDIDLMVIIDDDAPPEKRTLNAGWESRRNYRGAVDVIPCRESIFQRKRNIVGTLAFDASREGVVVYERS